MRADFRIFLDACVLANQGVCDLLLRLSERPRLVVPHWSAEVMAEVRRTHVHRLKWPVPLADSFQTRVREALPDDKTDSYSVRPRFDQIRSRCMTTDSFISKVWPFCPTLRDDGVGCGDQPLSASAANSPTRSAPRRSPPGRRCT